MSIDGRHKTFTTIGANARNAVLDETADLRARTAALRLAHAHAKAFQTAPGSMNDKLVALFRSLEEMRACDGAMCAHCIDILCENILPDVKKEIT